VRSMGSIRILVVDDADEVRRDLRTILQLTPDLSVAGEAANGLEAVELAAHLTPDVVLMDLRLPGLDGFEATEQIKKRDPAPAVVILTIYGQEEHRARAVSQGADAFVEKAAGVDTLLAAIRRVARGGTSLTAVANRPEQEENSGV